MHTNEKKSTQLPSISINQSKLKLILQLKKKKSISQLKQKGRNNQSSQKKKINLTQGCSFTPSTVNKTQYPKKESMLTSFYTFSSTTPKNKINLFKRNSHFFNKKNSSYFSYLSNHINPINSTNSFNAHSITLRNLSRLESIDETVKNSFAKIVTNVNRTHYQSKHLNTRYEEFLSNEDNRINKELIDLKPKYKDPLFVEQYKKHTDFAKLIEQLIKLKTRITPQLIRDLKNKSENQIGIEKRRMMMMNQKNGSKTIYKLLNYRQFAVNQAKNK